LAYPDSEQLSAGSNTADRFISPDSIYQKYDADELE